MDKILGKKVGNNYQNLENIIKLEKCKSAYIKIKSFLPKSATNFNTTIGYKTDYSK